VKRHPVLHGLIWAFAALLGFAVVLSQTFVQQVEARIETHNVSPLLGDDRPAPALPPDDAAKGRALNILLMGSDDRSGANAAIGGKEAGQRNDTTIIMHISADRTRVELLSIPRDSMVRLAQCERSDGSVQRSYTGMFNEAFANGGKFGSKSDAAACTMRTVESLTNIRINHWAVVDFAGFQAMVNAIGGVPMCIPEAVRDDYSGLNLAAGPQVLDGVQALQYARARHGTGFSGSDLDRIDRQQQLLKNLARKVVGAEVLFNPKELFAFISATAQSVTMDEELGNIDGYSVGLGLSLRNLDPKAGIVMATVPVKGYAPNPNRVEFSAAAAPIFAAMAQDQPIAPLLDKNSASPANDPEATEGPATPVSPGADGAMEPERESEADILASCLA
jgi:LCP family protein required for cell wall assembly